MHEGLTPSLFLCCFFAAAVAVLLFAAAMCTAAVCAPRTPPPAQTPTTQLAELQAAAQGVPAWERQLAREPSGPTLLQQIDGLHARRGRLAWLRKHQQQQQHKGSGSVASKHPSALAVLRMAQARFCGLYPDYPGDKK